MTHPFLTDSSAFEGREQARDELISLALRVASHQRGEDHLQDADTLKAKFTREKDEYCEAATHTNGHDENFVNLLAEAADLVYYAAQLTHLKYPAETTEGYTLESLLFSYRVDIDLAFKAALVKYRLRASQPNNKNVDAENAAIRAALEEE